MKRKVAWVGLCVALAACSKKPVEPAPDAAVSSDPKEASTSPRAKRLAELLEGKPSEDAFARILALFQPVGQGGRDEHQLPPWRDDDERKRALEQALAGLAPWDDGLRVLNANGSSSAIPDWGRLVRRFVFYRLSQNVAPAIAQLVQSPSLAGVTIIEVVKCDVFAWKTLAAAPSVRPKRLVVHDTVIQDADWSALLPATLEGLEGLETSSMSFSKERYGRVLDALPKLTRLACRDCRSESLRTALERTDLVRRLEHLDFKGAVRMGDKIPSNLGDADLDALVATSELKNLRVLDLRDNRFSAEAKARLRAAPQFAKASILLD
jgi:hypothetical protein